MHALGKLKHRQQVLVTRFKATNAMLSLIVMGKIMDMSARGRQLQERQSPSCATFRHTPYLSLLTTLHGLQKVAKHFDLESLVVFHATKD